MRQGQSRDEAESTALREYGDPAAARRELTAIDRRAARRTSWSEWVAGCRQDLRFAVRALRARPAFALTVLLTIALGVGANAAIFSVVDVVLLRPLPYAQPDRLVHLWETYHSSVDNRSEASYPDYLDWRTRNRGFADLAGYHGSGFLFGGDQAQSIRGARVTANFFDLLGVRAALGRSFVSGEDDADAPPVVMLTDGLWRRQFAADPAVVGRRITLNGAAATIVGVLPAAFSFSRQGDAELWGTISRGKAYREQRGNHWLNVVARLKPEVSAAAAGADLSRIMHDLAREYPQSDAGRDGLVVLLQQELVGSVRPVLVLLYGAVVVVLLVACVNVANLLLIRGTDRQRELAVRIALGADRSRLVRQLLTESLLLGVAGGIAGLVVAQIGVHSLIALIPAQQVRGIPRLAAAGLDARIIIYTIGLSIVSGLAFGIVPAFRASRPALTEDLKGGGRGATSGSARLRDALVMGEIALTVVLLSGAALFGRSLMRLLAIDPGFRVQHLATANVVVPAGDYRDVARLTEFYRRLLASVSALPGVDAVGMVSKLPLDFGNSLGFTIVGRPPVDPSERPSASYREASTDYYRAMGIPTLRGRVFDASDNRQAPASTGVINRALAEAYFPNQNPVGQQLNVSGDTMTIIGVVGDVPIGNIDDKVPPTLYLSLERFPETAMAIAVRTTVDPATIGRGLRQAIADIDRGVAVTPVVTMDQLLTQSPSVFVRRFPLFLIGAFAVTALLLAMIGIYGVVSYSVAQRRREMGIRTALGAQSAALVRLVVAHGVRMAAVGIAIGIVAVMLVGRLSSKLLYGVSANDPMTHVVVALVLGSVAIASTILPARRATRVDPASALRAE